MAEGDGAQGDLLTGDKGGAAAGGAGTEGAGAAAGAAAGAGAASGAAAAAGADDAAAKAAATEAARVAALTPEQKAAEAKAATDKAAADGKAADAPIDYSVIKMPEGMKADAVFEDAVKLFGENKIAPDVAQKLIDFTAERDKQLVKAVNDGNTEAWTKMRGEWKADTEKNVTAEDRGAAKQFAEKLFDKKTADMLEAYGLTDHRGFVEAMVKAGKAIKDDTFVAGNAGANGAGSDARKMFPNSNMNP